MQQVRFLNSKGDFFMERPENYSYLYFPLASETGLKSAVTPTLGGDSKIDQEHFLPSHNQPDSKVLTGGGLPGSSLLVRYCRYHGFTRQMCSPPSCVIPIEIVVHFGLVIGTDCHRCIIQRCQQILFDVSDIRNAFL